MFDDHNRYTFCPGTRWREMDDQNVYLVLYYNPNTDWKKPLRSAYDIKSNYFIHKAYNELVVISKEVCTIGELEDIQKAHVDQYGKELDVTFSEGMNCAPEEEDDK